ncbi:hypothetical protein EMA8858_02272 [Emticicia aquatica]|jgi:hypothetical protein|uniref:DUF2911 domain-containing protein n=1 Tax=Emticicia aquatica TaxID=1681835 RepID=A0ABM9AR88_9BACT|nr:DUF2911 domain-containing protein [Emticicia aquatica]CAH0996142.1 hypothetical protein EMA8858_02272 [Emticicia aquatica]
MKKTLLFICVFGFLVIQSQAQKLRGIDKSPMDMAYYPDNFAHDRKFAPQLIGNMPAIVRVTYSRPAKKEREIFGTKIVPYGEVWRVGANESTEIKFYQDVTIQGKKVKAGTYSLFAIPTATEWTIILNKDLDFWGAYSYNAANDLLRVNIPVKKTEEIVENFSIQCVKGGDKETIMKMAWDSTLVELPISF